jgi:MFS transporter, DHA2 family, multidrug resistance protein
MTCVALFTISSFLCGMAPSLAFLLAARVFQGAGGGGLAPSEQAILTDTFPASQRGSAFALYGVAVVVAPAIGPTLGGWITDNYSWRWIFYINIPVGILSLTLTHFLVPSDKKLPRNPAPAKTSTFSASDSWRSASAVSRSSSTAAKSTIGSALLSSPPSPLSPPPA